MIFEDYKHLIKAYSWHANVKTLHNNNLVFFKYLPGANSAITNRLYILYTGLVLSINIFFSQS